MAKADDNILKEIRENFALAKSAWQEIHSEGQTDIKFLSGDPWDEKERLARRAANRPCLALDELNQYVNQLINNVRQSKRSIEVLPRGAGSDDKTAELRGNMIRAIEYRSRAQQAYITAFENAAQRSYGYFRIATEYVSDSSFDQQLVVKRMPNPDAVLFDPYFKEADASDANWCFVLDSMPTEEFDREYPQAENASKSFTGEMIAGARDWIGGDQIQVAEYWRVEREQKVLVLVDGPDGAQAVFQDELDGKKTRILQKRKVWARSIVQYITNGVEILERNEWAGKYIPIIPVFGKELWVKESTGAKRKLFSLIRLARDPYMLYCYYRTCEAEVVGMTPKTPFVGYEGQFEGHEDEWQNVNTAPIAFLQAKPMLDATGGQILPLPQRQPYEPAIQPLEIGAEAARQAIQSACGINPLPTPALRQNQKSGVALQQIQQSEDIGSFHFVDNYNRALEHAGRVMNDLLDKIHDVPQEVPIRDQAGENKVVRINEAVPDPQTGQVQQLTLGDGDHEVTISTGPSYQSQREDANDFVNLIVQNLKSLPIPPPIAQRILSLSIRLKQIGPIGDEIADMLAPDDQQQLPPQAMQAIQQGQQQVQQLNAYAQQLEAAVKKLEQEKDAKLIDNYFKLEIEKIHADTQKAVAEIQTKAQNQRERERSLMDLQSDFHKSAHEAAMQADEHQNALDMQQTMQQNQPEGDPSQAHASDGTPQQS